MLVAVCAATRAVIAYSVLATLRVVCPTKQAEHSRNRSKIDPATWPWSGSFHRCPDGHFAPEFYAKRKFNNNREPGRFEVIRFCTRRLIFVSIFMIALIFLPS